MAAYHISVSSTLYVLGWFCEAVCVHMLCVCWLRIGIAIRKTAIMTRLIKSNAGDVNCVRTKQQVKF